MNVQERAEAVAILRYVNVFAMETLARWIPTTPEMEVKVLFGRHLWLAAQVADRLGRRARELRAPLHHTREPHAAFVRALREMAARTATADRIEAFHNVGLASLERAYADYAARTDALLDEPSVRIIEDGARDVKRMRRECGQLLEEFAGLRSFDKGALGVIREAFAMGEPLIRSAVEAPAA